MDVDGCDDGAAGAGRAQEAPALKTDKDKLSYALGMDFGTQFKARSMDIDVDVFARALKTRSPAPRR